MVAANPKKKVIKMKMTVSLSVIDVGYGIFKDDDGKEIKYATLVALDEYKESEGKVGFPQAKYPITDSAGGPDHVAAKAIAEHFKKEFLTTGVIQPVVMTLQAGMKSSGGKKIVTIQGLDSQPMKRAKAEA